MARGLFVTGFTVSEVLAIQRRAKDLLLEGKTIMNWNDAETSASKQFTMAVGDICLLSKHRSFAARRLLNPMNYPGLRSVSGLPGPFLHPEGMIGGNPFAVKIPCISDDGGHCPGAPMSKEIHEGKVTEWRSQSPFGYAECEGDRVFLHIGNFIERAKWPEEGDMVSFQMGEDEKGRPCARNVVLLTWGSVLRWPHFVELALLLVLPALAVPKLGGLLSPWWIALCALVTSACAALNLWFDKRFAMKSRSRVPEATLHLFELTGGWPGSFLAQRVFRHKISKKSYQIIFWLIVLIYQLLALDLLCGGFFYNGLRQLGGGIQ